MDLSIHRFFLADQFFSRIIRAGNFLFSFSLSVPFTERNLNPKAACLKRREEEKAEDGPKLPGHLAAHIAHPHPHPHAHSQPPFSAMPVNILSS